MSELILSREKTLTVDGYNMDKYLWKELLYNTEQELKKELKFVLLLELKPTGNVMLMLRAAFVS